jgi:hypothetical protein
VHSYVSTILSFSTKCVELEDIMLSETNQT